MHEAVKYAHDEDPRGDLDLVEYEFSPFSPGEKINSLGIKRPPKLSPIEGKIRVTTPARIHLTVMDMNRFAPNRPGGGGVGFALQIYCFAEVEATAGETIIDYSRSRSSAILPRSSRRRSATMAAF